MSEPIFDLASFARHRPWCPEYDGPGDCTCGLYALLDSIRCACGHKVSIHTNRDVSDAVGWPCNECKSARCTGFRSARDTGARGEGGVVVEPVCESPVTHGEQFHTCVGLRSYSERVNRTPPTTPPTTGAPAAGRGGEG